MKKIFVAISGLAVLGCTALRADQTNTIIVLDKNNVAVMSEIWTLTGDTEDVRLGHTDSDGRLATVFDGNPGQRILILPDDTGTFYRNRKTECPLQKQNVIHVSRVSDFNDLLEMAKLAQVNKEYGKAAKLYNTMAETAEEFDNTIAITYREKSVECLGKQFNALPFKWDASPQNSRPTSFEQIKQNQLRTEDLMSDQLKTKVKTFQLKNGLNTSGELDKATWNKISDMRLTPGTLGGQANGP